MPSDTKGKAKKKSGFFHRSKNRVAEEVKSVADAGKSGSSKSKEIIQGFGEELSGNDKESKVNKLLGKKDDIIDGLGERLTGDDSKTSKIKGVIDKKDDIIKGFGEGVTGGDDRKSGVNSLLDKKTESDLNSQQPGYVRGMAAHLDNFIRKSPNGFPGPQNASKMRKVESFRTSTREVSEATADGVASKVEGIKKKVYTTQTPYGEKTVEITEKIQQPSTSGTRLGDIKSVGGADIDSDNPKEIGKINVQETDGIFQSIPGSRKVKKYTHRSSKRIESAHSDPRVNEWNLKERLKESRTDFRDLPEMTVDVSSSQASPEATRKVLSKDLDLKTYGNQGDRSSLSSSNISSQGFPRGRKKKYKRFVVRGDSGRTGKGAVISKHESFTRSPDLSEARNMSKAVITKHESFNYPPTSRNKSEISAHNVTQRDFARMEQSQRKLINPEPQQHVKSEIQLFVRPHEAAEDLQITNWQVQESPPDVANKEITAWEIREVENYPMRRTDQTDDSKFRSVTFDSSVQQDSSSDTDSGIYREDHWVVYHSIPQQYYISSTDGGIDTSWQGDYAQRNFAPATFSKRTTDLTGKMMSRMNYGKDRRDDGQQVSDHYIYHYADEMRRRKLQDLVLGSMDAAAVADLNTSSTTLDSGRSSSTTSSPTVSRRARKGTKHRSTRRFRPISDSVRQRIDVDHEDEEVQGRPETAYEAGTTNSVDMVDEKIRVGIEDSIAKVIVQVGFERYSLLDLEADLWKRSRVIVTRTIEMDLKSTPEGEAVQRGILSSHHTPSIGWRKGGRGGRTSERQLSDVDTYTIFNTLMTIAEGDEEEEDEEDSMDVTDGVSTVKPMHLQAAYDPRLKS